MNKLLQSVPLLLQGEAFIATVAAATVAENLYTTAFVYCCIE